MGTSMSTWAPGSAGAGSDTSSTMRRIPAAISSASTTVPRCQTCFLAAAIAVSLRLLIATGEPDLRLQLAGEQSADPHSPGVDVEVVELVVGVGLDGDLLGLKHGGVLVEHAPDGVADLGGQQLTIQVVVAHPSPVVTAGGGGLCGAGGVYG